LKTTFIVGIIALFVVSSFAPMSFGTDIESTEQSTNDNFDRYMYPEFYDCYNVDEIPDYEEQCSMDDKQDYEIKESKDVAIEEPTQPLGDPMDSPWPMFKYDVRNTGRSPYSTADNPGDNVWWFELERYIQGSGVIDKEGVLYFIGGDDFYAIYPNKTLKWSVDLVGWSLGSSPAIDENGTIYIGTFGYQSGFYAINSNGTILWKHPIDDTFSSPVITNEGIIIFTDTNNWYIKAIYPNGTLKWKYKTNHVVYSSPVIGNDGTIYCGSHDTYLYALYPNNGTLKWKYKTGHWIRVSPCISDDGTIYVVSLDNYLHAVNPDGSLKWKTSVGAGTHPSIGPYGTIYCGYGQLCAINPNGSVKWKYDVSGEIRGSSPCISDDGTIYFGTNNGWFYAVNSDGAEKWRKRIGVCEFAPIIDDKGIVYVGDSYEIQHDCGLYLKYTSAGFLYKFDELDPDGPVVTEIIGPSECELLEWYFFTFKAKSPLNKEIFYWLDWGDHCLHGWDGPHNSTQEISHQHRWWGKGPYTIRCRAKDIDGRWGPWETFVVTIITPRSKVINSNSLFLRFLEQFPLLNKFLTLF